MPWFPELSAAHMLARQARTDALVPFYQAIREVEPDVLLASWANAPALDDPRAGLVSGAEAFTRWVQTTRGWLDSTGASAHSVNLIVTAGRTVEEVSLELTSDGERIELPVAIVTDRDAVRRITAIRIYHSLWSLTGGHEVRSPLLQDDPGLEAADVVGRYQRALAAGDLDGVLDAYEEDAIVREPAGGHYVYQGKERLSRIYSIMFADGAGIRLRRCTVTDDGISCAVEYTCEQWGSTSIPPQGGVAVYQRGASGKLAFGRIYDDVAPPAASDSSS